MDQSEIDDSYLLGPLDEIDLKDMNNNTLSIFSEGSSDDFLNENCGSEFLQTENVGIVTPAKAKSKSTSSKTKAPNNAHNAMAAAIVKSDSSDSAKKGLPTKFDVLCGQSRVCASHTGNRRFQVVLEMYADQYQVAKSKQEKMMLTKEIVGVIAGSGGRFLKYKDGMWIEISNVTARDKVSHALRTKVQSKKRQQDEKIPSAPKRRASIRRHRNSRRTSAPSAVPSLADVRAVSFDGSTTSSTSIMDELLRTQREIFEQLTQNDKSGTSAQEHPLKRRETW
eukprot:scaffold1830_cov117-Cylindrotheca_fusiformis.AAC.6